MNKIRQKISKQVWLTIIVGLLSFGILSAQGWEKVISGNDTAFGHGIVTTSDGNMVVSGGSMNGFGVDSWSDVLAKIDNDGNVLWVKILSENNISLNSFEVLAPTNDGGVIWGEGAEQGMTHPRIIKVDSDGNFEWDILFDFLASGELTLRDIVQVADGGYLFVGENEEDEFYLTKINADGSVNWFQQTDMVFSPGRMLETMGQDILIAGSYPISPGFNGLSLIKMDIDGNLLWSESYSGGYSFVEIGEMSNENIIVIGGPSILKLDNQGTLLTTIDLQNSMGDATYLPDEGFMTIALYNPFVNFSETGIILSKLDLDGNVIWEKIFNYYVGQDDVYGVTATSDGGYAITGYVQIPLPGFRGLYVLKTDEDGIVYGNEISGTIKSDENLDCIPNDDEPSLANWIITATRPGKTFSTLSDFDGNYFLPVDIGTFELTVSPPVDYWSVCSNNISLDYSNILNTDSIDFSVQPIIECPFLDLNSAIPFLRPCFDDSPYKISYCNNGTVEAEDVYIEVILDSEITPVSSSIPWTSQNGNTLIFELGNLPSGECGEIDMDLMLDCDATIGASYCIESHIYPDSICSPPSSNWEGAFVEVSGACQDSSVVFQIDNTGLGDMSENGVFIIVEDAVLILLNQFNLGSGQSTPVTLPANGSTYFLMSTQEPNAPGNPYPIAALEGCGTNDSGEFSISYLNQFGQGDNDPFVDIDCRVATSSFDPNDKQGFPLGFEDEHFIEPNTDLEYLIRFQNTGTDTAFTVVVKDTLSDLLDITTLRKSVASHDYDLKISGENILEFTFYDIMLPDSNVNESASHGFVEFKISQKRDLPLGNVIKNKAAIYFDYNAPIITNETFHTIGLDFITVSIQNPIEEENRIQVYPNPLQDYAIFEMEKELKNGMIEIFDLSGKLAWQQKVTGKQFEIERNDLKSGFYFYRITEDNRVINSGKIVVN